MLQLVCTDVDGSTVSLVLHVPDTAIWVWVTEVGWEDLA